MTQWLQFSYIFGSFFSLLPSSEAVIRNIQSFSLSITNGNNHWNIWSQNCSVVSIKLNVIYLKTIRDKRSLFEIKTDLMDWMRIRVEDRTGICSTFINSTKAGNFRAIWHRFQNLIFKCFRKYKEFFAKAVELKAKSLKESINLFPVFLFSKIITIFQIIIIEFTLIPVN